jgi:transporter family protein
MGGEPAGGDLGWLPWALAAAALSALMSVLTKAGLRDVDPGVGLAIQAPCLAVFAWAAVLARGRVGELADADGRTWACLILDGVAISLAYACLFRALKLGDASAVSPVDKLSLVFAVVLAALFLGERLTWQTGVGAGLMAAGAVVIALGKG